jgi:hypothetical protein
MNAIETSYYEEAIAAGFTDEMARLAAAVGGYIATSQTKIITTTMHEGHEIRYTTGFDNKSMKYRWILNDTSRSFIVMQHDTLEEAKATIDQYVEGELI